MYFCREIINTTVMLKKFSVSNFRGFPQKIEWDLSKPNRYAFNQHAVVKDIIKNGIIYGPNGTGKTNFSLAIFDLVYHLTQKWKDSTYFNNYVYAGKADMPVSFEYVFDFSGTTLSYNYSKNAEGILQSEELAVNGKQVFTRGGDSFKINEDEFPLSETVKNDFGLNRNNVSIVNFLLSAFPLKKGHYLLLLSDFANNMLWFRCLRENQFVGFEQKRTQIFQYIIQNNLITKFEEFLCRVSGQKFSFEVVSTDNERLYCDIDGKLIPFDVIESTGTQSLSLLFYWMSKLNEASFVFIDEFDAFYHYNLSFEVCKELFSLNCQLFLSSHNTYLMTNDLLRPDCNFILNDNKIKPLSNCTEKELRFDHNIEKMFRGGAFKV